MVWRKMDLFIILYIYNILPKAIGVVSEEYKDKAEKEDKKVFNIERRFLQDLDDDQWHVSHLKDSGLDVNNKCKDETFKDKAVKYRRMLKNDGALVDFVSADPLPFDISEINEAVCRVGSEIDSNETGLPTNKTNTDNLNLEKKNSNLKLEDVNKTGAQLEQHKSNSLVEVNVATTVNVKDTVLEDAKLDNITKEKSRRASEYMFSSVEYYDESAEFDESVCHDAVEVFTLEIDQLRNYDVECEMLLEWRSLE